MDLSNYPRFYIVLFLRYSIVAGLAFIVFYILFSNKFSRIKIQKSFPKVTDYTREVFYSLLSMGIIALCIFMVRSPHIKPHTRFYWSVSDYDWPYLILSVLLALLIHDTYFYWTHRLMHHPKLFKLFHLVHHRSTNPSPWAAYSFHPLEAVIEGLAVWVIVFTIPIHPIALASFGLLMIVYNVYGHLGYEIYPQWLVNSRIGRWLNTSTNHNMHHKYFNDNYGLYFRFWDEIMKTTHPKYEETVREIVGNQKPL